MHTTTETTITEITIVILHFKLLTYSATKQESKTFQNHYFRLKIAQICLLVSRMATTTIFIALLQNFIFSIYS